MNERQTPTDPPLPMPQTLPAPTRDLDQGLRDLGKFGLCLIAGGITGDTLKRARHALYRAAEDDRARGWEKKDFALDLDDNNQRVWNLLNRDPVFADLAEHPIALHFVRSVLGWPALLSNISGNITEPGAGLGALHCDQLFVPEPWPKDPQGLNVAWCIDDFTAENGGTEIVVGSHLWHRAPTAADSEVPMVPVEAEAGSVFVFESRLWHRTGANTSKDTKRGAVFPFYARPIYRTQENWFLSLDPGIRRHASDDLLTLLAFKSEGFGLVYGESPQ